MKKNKEVTSRVESCNKFIEERLGKKLNNMSDKELCAHYKELDVSINQVDCFGVQDVQCHAILGDEIARRDIDISEDLIFINSGGEEVL